MQIIPLYRLHCYRYDYCNRTAALVATLPSDSWTSIGLEVDAIVDIAPGRWAAFEVKLGVGWVDEAARALLKFAGRVDTDRCGEPAALGVIVGSDYGYQRPDGVSVIPLGALGPSARFSRRDASLASIRGRPSP